MDDPARVNGATRETDQRYIIQRNELHRAGEKVNLCGTSFRANKMY